MSITLSGMTTGMKIPALIHTVKLTKCTECPDFSNGLRNLDIQNCTFKTLPTLPETLEILWIEHTPITTLPDLPLGLKKLYILETNVNPSTVKIPETVEHYYIGKYAEDKDE